MLEKDHKTINRVVTVEYQQKTDLQHFKIHFNLFCNYLSKNIYFLLLLNICTFYALFGDNLRILFFNTHADIYFNVLVILILLLFIFEVVMYLHTEKTYLLGFYFFLDIISTFFLIFDLTWI